MQDNEQQEELTTTYKHKAFCPVCKHLLHEEPGHEPWCLVYTQQPVSGYMPPQLLAQQQQAALQQQMAAAQSMQGHNPVDIQELKEEWAMLKQGKIPRKDVSAIASASADGYEVARIYREGRDKLLEELRIQLEINRRLSRELIDVRLENARLRLKHEDLGGS